jgi:hypothetical protein
VALIAYKPALRALGDRVDASKHPGDVRPDLIDLRVWNSFEALVIDASLDARNRARALS